MAVDKDISRELRELRESTLKLAASLAQYRLADRNLIERADNLGRS